MTSNMSAATFRICCLGGHILRPSLATSPAPASLKPALTKGISSAAQKVLDTRKEINVLQSFISYLDTGVVGDNAVVFLHGNPTSAFLWRNVIPHVSTIARCLAPDLVGMGRSGKEPNHRYRFVDQYEYFSTWMEAMRLPPKVTIVCHDWGSALGFHWCNLNRDRVQAIVFMESIVAPTPSWEMIPRGMRRVYQSVRKPEGYDLVLKKNIFVERALPGSIMRKLEDDEMAEYRKPFLEEGDSRLAVLAFGQEIPVLGDGPEDVVQLVNAYGRWLETTVDVPKLAIEPEPGLFGKDTMTVYGSWPNLRRVQVKGLHFLQEDSPDEIGQAIAKFLLDTVYHK